MAAAQPQHRHEGQPHDRPRDYTEDLPPPDAPDVEHRQRQHEDQHRRRRVRRQYHHAREHDGQEYREPALTPYALLLRPHPCPELEARHDLQRAYRRLPLGQLVGQIHDDGELEHLRRLELESQHRDPAGGAVGGLARKVYHQRQQQRHPEQQVRKTAVCLAVDAVHDEYGYRAQRQQEKLRAQEFRRRRRRTGVVGHLRRGRVYHKHRDDHQRDDDHPQHTVPAQKTARRVYHARARRTGGALRRPFRSVGLIRDCRPRLVKLLLLVHSSLRFICSHTVMPPPQTERLPLRAARYRLPSTLSRTHCLKSSPRCS